MARPVLKPTIPSITKEERTALSANSFGESLDLTAYNLAGLPGNILDLEPRKAALGRGIQQAQAVSGLFFGQTAAAQEISGQLAFQAQLYSNYLSNLAAGARPSYGTGTPEPNLLRTGLIGEQAARFGIGAPGMAASAAEFAAAPEIQRLRFGGARATYKPIPSLALFGR